MLSFLKKLFLPKQINAAQAWQQLGNDTQNAYWLYAAPVHLVLQRDTFSLSEPVPVLLLRAEIDALTSALNKHFGAGVVKAMFFWHEKYWFLRLQSHPNIETVAPELAINKAIDTFLPTGEGAIQWASFTNELQMLLFAHPVNQAREAKGLPAINSLWCYGGGQLESQTKSYAN